MWDGCGESWKLQGFSCLKKFRGGAQEWVSYIKKVSSDNQIKLVQELHPNPHVHSFSMSAIWKIQCLDISLWEIKRPPSHYSVLNMRSGILPASQSLPDGSQCWTGIFLALGRDEREGWLLSKETKEQKKWGREGAPLSLNFLRRHWLLCLRHFMLLL